ncbi:MAG: hypothetical protein K0B05_08825 [Bacteroidales bacterium]|nr:hypothetical protein [Bacteroidales bacterium]
MKRHLLSVTALLFTIALTAQQSVLLKMNPEKNKPYRLKSVTEQTVTQTVSGNPQTVESKVIYTLSLKVLDMTPDFMVAEVHFDTIITNTNTMGKMSSINSTVEGDIKSSETSDIMSCIMNRLSKNAVFTKIDYAGKPVEIVNAKMLSDMVLKDTASVTLTEPLASAIKAQAAAAVSGNNLKTMIGGFTWHLPGKEVRVGEKWTISDQVNSGGMLLAVSTTYRLDGINGNNAGLTVESVIRAAENAPPIKSAGAVCYCCPAPDA